MQLTEFPYLKNKETNTWRNLQVFVFAKWYANQMLFLPFVELELWQWISIFFYPLNFLKILGVTLFLQRRLNQFFIVHNRQYAENRIENGV